MEKTLNRGDICMARWRGYKTWFMGEVLKVYKDRDGENLLVDVEYHDGLIEVSTRCSTL
jgi:hypothetical protein